jgi:hypothetical protein
MKRQILPTLAVCAMLTSAVHAQSYQRQATITGGGSPDRGKCTIEVVVDIVAQVEIRGATATLRNVSGQPPQWRRFECTAAMPANPSNFAFAGVDGRGRQSLVRDPRNGGIALVQIEDKDGGSEGYTFDITWDSRGSGNGGNPPNTPNAGAVAGNPPTYRDNGQNRSNEYGQHDPNAGAVTGNPPTYRDNGQDRDRSGDQYRPNYRDNYRESSYYRRYGHGFTPEEAVRTCQQEVVRQATQRFRSSDIHFERTMIDNNPGREDWVTGTLDIHRGPRGETYGFSCSMDFDSGRVRSAQLDPRPMQPDRR